LPVFRRNKAFGLARHVKAFLNLEGGAAEGAAPDVAYREESGNARQQHVSVLRKRIKSKQREIRGLQEEWRVAKRTAKGVDRRERKKRLMREKQELFQLQNALRAVKERRAEGIPDGQADQLEPGALPDFVVIGAQKCGTSTFYYLLVQHPHIDMPITKELHYFDNFYEEGLDWYRRCFPPPRFKDGQRCVTGEGTPKYLFDPPVPKRMVKVVPQAKLIVLLRNPVNRAFSHYHHQVRNSDERRSFEEAIEEEEARLRVEWPRVLEDDGYAWNYQQSSYLARGLYADQLQRWSKYFDKEQMLVLKSEDFFESPQDAVKRASDFLGLPEWEPEGAIRNKNEGGYTQKMDPDTRKQLEEYFAPHNQRLYEYLGMDFGW
jgi:hypothetical protein